MSFKFSKVIGDVIDLGADFLMGEEVMTSDRARRGEGPEREGGGFIDFLRGGAEAYKAMTDSDDDKEAFQAVEYEKPSIRRYSGRAQVSGALTTGPGLVGLSDPRVQNMLRNLANRVHANRDMNRLSRDMRVAMNRRQGQRTLGLEAARAPQVKEAAPAAVRKHPEEKT